MDDSLYNLIDQLEEREPQSQAQLHRFRAEQYAVPPGGEQFQLPVATRQGRQHQPRDRYRVVQDIVEDDGYDYGYDDSGNMQLDEFDERLLQSPYYDRQRQSECGRARLTFPPRTEEQHGLGIRMVADEGYPNPNVRQSLSRFAYNPRQSQVPSFELLHGESSSPAFEAGRRKEHFNSSQRRPVHRQSEDEEHFESPELNAQNTQSFSPVKSARKPLRTFNVPHTGPVIQGIPLVPVSALPDRLRTIFPFPTFNAVQSKCFDHVFQSDNNFVLASPTGSGKTAVLELAICRAIATNANDQYKFVYQAPTKALCSERSRDWQKKFSQIGLNCVELTGDSDAADLRNVQSANIIVTTPEKWDSITRKWKDHEKLMRLIKLFLVDEVHILKEDRGAVLETVVSRMKSIGTDVRFLALSATVPNFGDVAKWLGRNSKDQHTPAASEKFGEEFRPVKLRKHVCGYICKNPNDFAFEKVLDGKLPEVVQKYSERKPIMIFCYTRNSTVSTAKLLAKWWASQPGTERLWLPPSSTIPMKNGDLSECISAGVAFHHAGLEFEDRNQVEKGFLNGDIAVICCTSTLAVGVNLPCHLVIVKNTVTYTSSGLQEYTDLEVMQMLGRAGRPQFDNSAVAVIMTRQSKAVRYETMVTGQDTLESKLHLNLIDHINAEIGLGTIRDLHSARKWLSGTFLYTRLQQNPSYYTLEGAKSGQIIEEQVDDICSRNIALLEEHKLVMNQHGFRCTEFGHAMARYYVHFETMKVFMGLQPKASLSEILSALAQASEFSAIRFRAGEKSLYKLINKSASIRFSIPVNLDLPAHKVSLLIQSVLGCVDIPWSGENQKHRGQYNLDVASAFRCVSSLIRCIIDCQISLADSISIGHAMTIERSLGARVWDDSPLQMKQIEGIGVVAVRKLVNAGIRSMEDLESTDPHRIETLVGRNPPFGLKVLEKLKSFPKLRVSLHIPSSSIKRCADGAQIQVKADIGFINETAPHRFEHKLVYVSFLAENSDGKKIYFARISGSKLGKGQSLVFPTVLSSPNQSINCYLMCDSIAGTMRTATVKPNIAPSMFPPPPKVIEDATRGQPDCPVSNMSRRRTESNGVPQKGTISTEEFGDDGIDDDELLTISHYHQVFDDIDDYAKPDENIGRQNKTKTGNTKNKRSQAAAAPTGLEDQDGEPRQLSNGKWACNHRCKDKQACKHMCCRDGLDKPPKKTAAKRVTSDEHFTQPLPKKPKVKGVPMQTKLQLSPSKRKTPAVVDEIDLTQQRKPNPTSDNRGKDRVGPDQRYENLKKGILHSHRTSISNQKPSYSYAAGGEHNLSFMRENSSFQKSNTANNYDDLQYEELLTQLGDPGASNNHPPRKDVEQSFAKGDPGVSDISAHAAPNHQSETFEDDDSTFGEVMIGLADSEELHEARAKFKGESLDVEQPIDDYHGRTSREQESSPHFDMDNDFYEGLKSLQPFEDIPVEKALMEPPHKSKPTTSSKMARAEDFDSGFLYAGSLPEASECEKMCKVEVDRENGRDYENTNVYDDAQKLQPYPQEHIEAKKENIPEQFKDLEPWLFEEFGDIVELVD